MTFVGFSFVPFVLKTNSTRISLYETPNSLC